MNKFINVLAFAFGAAAGSVVTWKMLKDKYAKYADEEINSYKEYRKQKEEKLKDRAKHEVLVDELGYVSKSKVEPKETTEPKTVYVIPPESFGELGYETVSLTYYADKVLADDYDEVIDDLDLIGGEESLNSFGEYEDDSVFVRNDENGTDYEILMDLRKYSDVVGKTPHSTDEVE